MVQISYQPSFIRALTSIRPPTLRCCYFVQEYNGSRKFPNSGCFREWSAPWLHFRTGVSRIVPLVGRRWSSVLRCSNWRSQDFARTNFRLSSWIHSCCFLRRSVFPPVSPRFDLAFHSSRCHVIVVLAGLFSQLGWDRRWRTSILSMMIGNLVIYIFGVPVLAWHLRATTGFGRVLVIGVVNFLAGDALKIGIAALLIPVGWKAFAFVFNRKDRTE